MGIGKRCMHRRRNPVSRGRGSGNAGAKTGFRHQGLPKRLGREEGQEGCSSRQAPFLGGFLRQTRGLAMLSAVTGFALVDAGTFCSRTLTIVEVIAGLFGDVNTRLDSV